MPNLDEFTECTEVADATCSVCESEHTGTLSFRSTSEASKDETDSENDSDLKTDYDLKLCKHCLFEAEGRFKNQDIQAVIRKFEEVRYIETNEDDNIVINTTSVLGDLSHIHYTTETTQVKERQNNQAVIVTIVELAGPSEIFDSTGQFIASPSPYTDVAQQVVTQHNEQRVENL